MCLLYYYFNMGNRDSFSSCDAEAIKSPFSDSTYLFYRKVVLASWLFWVPIVRVFESMD